MMNSDKIMSSFTPTPFQSNANFHCQEHDFDQMAFNNCNTTINKLTTAKCSYLHYLHKMVLPCGVTPVPSIGEE